jgi:hypothetical protein
LDPANAPGLLPWNMSSIRARLDQRDAAFATLPAASTPLPMCGWTLTPI